MKREDFRNSVFKMTLNEEKYKSNFGLDLIASFEGRFRKDEKGLVMNETGIGLTSVGIVGYESSSANYKKAHIFACKHSRFSKIPLHRHEYIELNYMYSGSVVIQINGVDITMNKGDLCFLDSDVVHLIKDTAENDILLNIIIPKRYFTSTFRNRFLGTDKLTKMLTDILSKEQDHNQYWLIQNQDNEFDNEIESIFCEFLDFKLGSASIIQNEIGNLLLKAARSLPRSDNKNEGMIVVEAIEYMSNNLFKSLTEVANHFNYSTSYLSKKIKKYTGKNFQETMNELKMELIAYKLRNTNQSIESIALEVGYKNLSFFYKKFFAIYNMTPNDYRHYDK